MVLSTNIPQFQSHRIYISLFTNVENAASIQSKVAELNYAFVDATTVCSQEQLLSAVYKALLESTYNRMRTKSLHSECILSLSPSSNIMDALKRFGIKEDSRNLICVKILESDEQFNHGDMIDVIKGDEIDFNDNNLSGLYDKEVIKKNYKLGNFKPESDEDLTRAVVNAIQLRGL